MLHSVCYIAIAIIIIIIAVVVVVVVVAIHCLYALFILFFISMRFVIFGECVEVGSVPLVPPSCYYMWLCVREIKAQTRQVSLRVARKPRLPTGWKCLKCSYTLAMSVLKIYIHTFTHSYKYIYITNHIETKRGESWNWNARFHSFIHSASWFIHSIQLVLFGWLFWDDNTTNRVYEYGWAWAWTTENIQSVQKNGR